MRSSMRNRLRLPGRLALLLGLGALSAAGGQARTADAAQPAGTAVLPQQSAKTIADLLIWREAGRVYVSESGKPAEELRLGATAEAAALVRLLESHDATAATPYPLRDRIILVGGGGSGFAWDSNQESRDGKKSTTDGAGKQ